MIHDASGWLPYVEILGACCRMGEYKGLKALEHAERFAVECRTIADRLPAREFKLAEQLRTAATAVALNIAEGCLKLSYRDYRRYLDTARTSLKESESCLRIINQAGYITTDEYIRIESLRDETARTLYGLIRAIERKIEAGETRRRIA